MMSAFSKHLLGLRNSIQESAEWPVVIPFASSHWIQDTDGVVTPTPFSSLSCSMVNLVQCMERSKHGLPNRALLENVHGYPSGAAFCLEGFIGGDAITSTNVINALKVAARSKGTVLRFHKKTQKKDIGKK